MPSVYRTWRRCLCLLVALGLRPLRQADVPPLGRRGALISPVLSLARGPSSPPAGAPAWTQELGRFPGLFEDFEGPSISWKPVATSTEGDRLKYPSWLTGSWKVDCKKRDVRFPQGWGVLSPQVPGVAMGSILRLPNVGAEPSLTWNFVADADGAKADWAKNLPATLEGFWPDATTQRMERSDDGHGTWALTYASPTALFRKDEPLTERTVMSQWLGADLWQQENQCYSVEWIRQTDLLQGQDGVADYKVLMTLTKGEKGISGRMRIAAFLQSVDAGYFEANGNAVAIYDYDLQLTSKSPKAT